MFKKPTVVSEDMIPRPLPMNIPEFQEWSDRIIKAACLPTKNIDTQKFALATMILQTAPTDFFRPDQYYIDLLRKAAADQLATQIVNDMKLAREKKIAEAQKLAETPTNVVPIENKEPNT